MDRRISLLVLAAFALGAAAQQPASPSAVPQGTPAPRAAKAAQKKGSGAAPQPGLQAPQGNLTIQVTRDDGTPVPDADVEIDGMRAGIGPSGTGPASAAGNTRSPAIRNAGPENSAENSVDQSGLFHPQPVSCPPPPPHKTAPAKPQSSQAPSRNAQSGDQTGSAQTGSGQPGQVPPAQPASADANPSKPHASAESADAQPACDPANMVRPGQAESIGELSGAKSDDAGGPSLPPGVIPLRTDDQGQLVLQLPPGAHTLSVSVYGFDPFTGSFTLSGRHRQIVQIKLSTAPTSVVFTVGADYRTQTESAITYALIPLEPVQVLDPLPARTRRRVL
jgi:hypothetical protein